MRFWLLCLYLLYGLLLTELIFFFFFFPPLTGSIPLRPTSVSMCSRVSRKHLCWCWQLNPTVHILLVLCCLAWHKWESKGWVEGPRCLSRRRFKPWTGRWELTLGNDPFEQIQEQVAMIHCSDFILTRRSPSHRQACLNYCCCYVTQQSEHWETRAITKSHCLLSWGGYDRLIPRVGILDPTWNMCWVGVCLVCPNSTTCVSPWEVLLELQ